MCEASAALRRVCNSQTLRKSAKCSSAAPHILSGKLRLIGVTQAARSSQFPVVPALGESIKGFDVTSWNGLFAPAGTPDDVVAKLNAEARKALNEPATAQALSAQSLDLALSSPAELKARIQLESARWGALIKAKAITAQ